VLGREHLPGRVAREYLETTLRVLDVVPKDELDQGVHAPREEPSQRCSLKCCDDEIKFEFLH
jgi:hypothetical protein